MQAHELMHLPTLESKNKKARTLATDKRLRDKKLERSHTRSAKSTWYGSRKDKSLFQSIKEQGVQDPVELQFRKNSNELPMLADGHHRVVAANRINPDMWLPVEYTPQKYEF